MALDGITIHALTDELARRLSGGRISKIVQPERDEIMLTVRCGDENERVLISAGASLPFVYLTDTNKQAPLTAPNFCMVLRKHLSGGRIVDITQPGLERIIEFMIESLDEMGDRCLRILTVELMGKHSNIILRKPDNVIIDSIKHISAATSSVREVLPGRNYFIPNADDKIDLHNFFLCESPGDLPSENISILCKPVPLSKSLYTTFTGLSPAVAESLCDEAGLDSGRGANTYSSDELCKLIAPLSRLNDIVSANDFSPSVIINEAGDPVEFEVTQLIQFKDMKRTEYGTVSQMLISYYEDRNEHALIRQKSSDLRKIVTTLLERFAKKYDIQKKQLADTAKMDKLRLYGELLQTYGYTAGDGDESIVCDNYYTGESITIPLDPTISPMANSVRYFDRYNKLKRTKEAVTKQLAETEADITHLRSVLASLDMASDESDLAQIRDELFDSGYIKKRSSAKKKSQAKSLPLRFASSDGFHILVGKNNYQNDELSFKIAKGNDWWFHAKQMPGSHVILQCEGKDPTDRAFEEAACIAAYYSSGRTMGKVEVDYVKKSELKKPAGAKPGFVVYYTNYSMTAKAVIPEGITAL
ncbi:MAG: NFACT family protein [Lachnospiraceae bacterium]|nr:NFACT family protein [Lachnospiraceae bacterium]